MKRRSLFGILFGGSAVAQMRIIDIPTSTAVARGANDYCPVCGTKADPYVRQTEADAYRAMGMPCRSIGGGQPGTVLSICGTPRETEKFGPPTQLIRCKNCNAAFYQDDKS